MAMWLVVIGVLPVVGASAMMMFGERTEIALLRFLGLLQLDQTMAGWVSVVGRVLRYAVVLGTVWVVTGLFYYFGPAGPRRGRPIMPGALLAAVLWLLITLAFAWYVRNIGNYNVLYGSIGAAIALLVWMYLLALISLIGFEFNEALPSRRT
jgi:membrane protein